MIERDIQKHREKSPRQVGKSTLVEHLLKGSPYFYWSGDEAGVREIIPDFLYQA